MAIESGLAPKEIAISIVGTESTMSPESVRSHAADWRISDACKSHPHDKPIMGLEQLAKDFTSVVVIGPAMTGVWESVTASETSQPITSSAERQRRS